MSVNSKMTAIADNIRALLGVSGKMGLDAMETNLGTEQTNVANAFTAIGNKGGTVPSSKVSGNLASAINSIPEGVTIQRKSGTFKTGYTNGQATVNCGFKPDLVAIDGNTNENAVVYPASPFHEANIITNTLFVIPTDVNTNIIAQLVLSQTNTGFTVQAHDISTSLGVTVCKNRTFNYIAIKYT